MNYNLLSFQACNNTVNIIKISLGKNKQTNKKIDYLIVLELLSKEQSQTLQVSVLENHFHYLRYWSKYKNTSHM